MSDVRLLARFGTADDLVAAAKAVHGQDGFVEDAFTPFPVEALDTVLGNRGTGLGWIIFAGAMLGAIGGYAMQYYSAVIDYPFMVGGRPMNSWPAFLPVTFELLVLGGALAGFLGMLIANGLPRLHHPLFDIEGFSLATRKRFFLLVRCGHDSAGRVRRKLEALDAEDIREASR